MQMQNWSSKGHGDNKVVSKENDSMEYMQEVLKKCKKQADEIERKKNQNPGQKERVLQYNNRPSKLETGLYLV